MNLKDQFEWDVVNQDNSPEAFAAVYCTELGIGGEFKTAIAHAIREQTQVHLKSLFIVGHPMDGSVIQEEEIRQAFLPSISVAARSFDQTSTFSPIIEYLSDGEIDRAEKEREKELKRKRRQTKGKRAVALPDREPQKTHRTPAIGLPEVDPATLSVSNIMPTTSRRAAAAAASVSIASLAASENRSEHDEYGGVGISMPMAAAAAPQHAQPQAAPVPPPKVSKIRGSFKPPAIARPEAVVNPRASMNKTESTACVIEQPASNGRAAANTSSFHKPKSEAKTTEETASGDVVLRNPMIDGVWHCTTCGIPDDIAIGRRKGPNGLKSQCGTCGKWWHQHRKLRQVEWIPDREHHLRIMREATIKNKRGRAPATPSRREKVEEKPPAPASPSSMSSISNQSDDLPLSKRSRTLSKSNGTGNSHVVKSEPYTVEKIKAEPFVLDSPTTSRAAETAASTNGQDASNNSASSSPLAIQSANMNLQKPDWLLQAENEMHEQYPHDVFHVIARVRGQPVDPNVPIADDEVWRLKCSDCPGKLYKPGPDETLNNFEVHLRNRLHRQKVADRVGISINGSHPASSDA
ncbi:SNF5-domain-containing protein [Auriculariales sp. MPI-PUGE-AT-0066]|nr:SNF5-domain-containing protein [Auriculariales sp. MPI-PUGE-AT-0066]